jgi:2-desacetyl-2-hydroxyethyl bacteriochlorophyllide A dehydrogenase
VSAKSAGLVEPLATALHGAALAGRLRDRAVLVTGGGPIGQLTVRIARHRGAARVVLVEPAPKRAAFARASGADEVLTPDAAQQALAARPVDVVIEASGSGAASALAIEALAPGGTLVVLGAGPGNTLDPTSILLKEIVVKGSFVYVDEFAEAIELLASGAIGVDDLVTSVAPLAGAMGAFEDLRRAASMKVLVAPSA